MRRRTTEENEEKRQISPGKEFPCHVENPTDRPHTHNQRSTVTEGCRDLFSATNGCEGRKGGRTEANERRHNHRRPGAALSRIETKVLPRQARNPHRKKDQDKLNERDEIVKLFDMEGDGEVGVGLVDERK